MPSMCALPKTCRSVWCPAPMPYGRYRNGVRVKCLPVSVGTIRKRQDVSALLQPVQEILSVINQRILAFALNFIGRQNYAQTEGLILSGAHTGMPRWLNSLIAVGKASFAF